jgi:ABC-type phosphate/phosphonate transport system substrate-binding protein
VRAAHGFVIGLALGLSLGFAARTSAQGPVGTLRFIGVAPDEEYEKADSALAEYLRRASGMTVERSIQETYYNAIKTVVESGDKPYVARMTPYAYVVAELEGAQFEVLATYLSKATGSLTYHSYFVVRAENEDFRFSPNPTLREVADYLAVNAKERPPRRFVFHDKFSTSSYFVPSLFFRSQRVFVPEPGQRSGRLIPLVAAQAEPGSGSSDLVRLVASGKADIAAVWDGTKAKFEGKPEWSNLRFIRVDAVLPNDLLVCSRSLPEATKAALKKAFRQMECGPGKTSFGGDFTCWSEINDAPEAREALAALRRSAIAQAAPVTVKIAPATTDPAALARYRRYVEAAEQAVRLAGTEFVLYDPDFHRWADVDWTLEIVHDGAVRVTSTINGIKSVAPQRFQVSFTDLQEDLPKRLEALIHGRMNRIRYVWSFEDRVPTIIRDVSFSLTPGTALPVQKITWTDPEKNEFMAGDEFEARVKEADFRKFQLDEASFPMTEAKILKVNPLSNAAYRVVLIRAPVERPLFRYLTLALVVLFLMAAVAVTMEVMRRRPVRRAQLAPVPET